ncbi:ser/Thr protein phosphatase family protein [Trematosphaeria pertusa]|uniref:Ser/Thr protein phosphatase family protein n=1 Tax=Trematosphaeria pertusa TaxID=390896 RepID=A0A6A6J2C6_9PLEO|nr:ser/Thr protein phosphatase family protein [Trematosphaeria pertusa]KAF2256869.1 ser/Thr protein phosphatase family protein [Trematosphaeria pertusa]
MLLTESSIRKRIAHRCERHQEIYSYLSISRAKHPATPHSSQPQAPQPYPTMPSPAPLPSYIKTRILILSDTHSASPLQNASNTHTAFRAPLPKADVLLHCGDLTMVGLMREYEQALEMLKGIEADLKLVIAGNHDISLDEAYYKRKGQHMQRLREPDDDMPMRARELWTGEKAREAGVTYLDEGTHIFTLKNGARLRVYASPYQPEFCDWAFPYFRNQDRYNPPHRCTPNAVPIAEKPVPDFLDIDVMMTHGPPMGIRDEVARDDHVGCEHLLRAVRRCRPRLHCFGHIHEGWGAERVKWKEGEELDAKWQQHVEKAEWVEVDEEKMAEERAAFVDISRSGARPVEFGKETLMVNASIMTVQYRPVQAPWVVDLDLEMAE